MIRLTMDEMQTLMKAREILSQFIGRVDSHADDAKKAHRALGITLENVALKAS